MKHKNGTREHGEKIESDSPENVIRPAGLWFACVKSILYSFLLHILISLRVCFAFIVAHLMLPLPLLPSPGRRGHKMSSLPFNSSFVRSL